MQASGSSLPIVLDSATPAGLTQQNELRKVQALIDALADSVDGWAMMTVRTFRLSDYEAVLALDIAEQMAYRGVQWEAANEKERAQLLMTSPRDRQLYASSDYCFVAEEDGVVIGFLFGLPLLPDVLFIDGVGVASEKRRQGVASSMYSTLLGKARERGIRRIQALITPDNDASMALHESAGFILRDRKEAMLEL